MEYNEFCEKVSKIEKIDSKLRIEIDKSDGDHKNPEAWKYIPQRNVRALHSVFSFAKDKGYDGFLDVGCGTGRIVAMARAFGFKKVCGVEFHAPYVELGRKAFGLSSKELIVKDAFKLSSQFLSTFGIIYTYMPMCDKEKMSLLHTQLFQRARGEAIVVEMYPVYYPVCRLDRTFSYNGCQPDICLQVRYWG